MVSVSRFKAGQYLVSDGRLILKKGNDWYICNGDGNETFGPIPTLKSAKEYVETGGVPLTSHNGGTGYGRRQSKKEFYSYLASESERGNYGPALLWTIFVIVFIFLFAYIRDSQS